MSSSIIGLVSGSTIPNAIQAVGSRETWQDGLLNLPTEALLRVAGFLTPEAFVRFAQVSVRPYQITRDERLYQVISNTKTITQNTETIIQNTETIIDMYNLLNLLTTNAPADTILTFFFNTLHLKNQNAIKHKMWEIQGNPHFIQNPDWAGDQIRANPHSPDFREAIETVQQAIETVQTAFAQVEQNSQTILHMLREGSLAVQEQSIPSQDLP